ncbi:UNVERIFIED_CONTAM: hypothetical protein LK11_43625 [Mumia flava]
MARTTRTVYRDVRLLGSDTPAVVATNGETLGWIGAQHDAPSWLDDADETVHARGALLTPGFVDAHVHLAMTGQALRTLDLTGAASLAEALERLRAHLASSDDDVVHGYGWDDTAWPDGPPTRTALDRVAGSRAVYLARVDAHSAVVSSALADRIDRIERCDGWSADGRVERAAHHRVRDLLHQHRSPAQRTEAIRTALDAFAAQGVVSVHEMGAPSLSPLDDFSLIREVRAESPRPHVATYWGEPGAYELAQELGLDGLAGDLNVDGSLGSRTAALHEPYDDAPGTCGHLYLDAGAVAEHVIGCTRAGVQAGFHVIGDRAASVAVEGLRRARDELGTSRVRAARHRLEHLEMPAPADLELLAQLGVTASVQPVFEATWGGDDGMYAERLGRPRARATNPFATMATIGVRMAFGSDAPVTRPDPWGALAAATGAAQGRRVPLDVAVAAATVGGWAACGHPSAGRLRTGAPAHLALWETPDADGDAAAAALAGGARCVRTVVSGRVVHDTPSD